MPAATLLTLLDDIASVLDDVALMTKVAAKKTAGVLGDDLALNAQQVTGVKADRELPVVWAVTKGSLLNKALLVPSALVISWLAPWAVIPLLMIGGAYLCYEGCEKLLHAMHARRHPEDPAAHAARLAALADERIDIVALERSKIRGAIRTDFILSAEIIVITLGTVATSTFLTQVAVLVAVALIMTVGVYGTVAGIVKLDDAGLWLSVRPGTRGSHKALRFAGRTILRGAPYLMKGLSVVGTAAMFLVGGGILSHGVPWMDAQVHALAEHAGQVPGIGAVLEYCAPALVNGLLGVAIGAAVLGAVMGCLRLVRRVKPAGESMTGASKATPPAAH